LLVLPTSFVIPAKAGISLGLVFKRLVQRESSLRSNDAF